MRETEIGSLPILDRLIEDAYGRLQRSDVFVDPESGAREIYTDYEAANDAVKGSGIDPTDLAMQLVKQTAVTPRELVESALDVELIPEYGWPEFFHRIAHVIVAAELEKRHPDIKGLYEERARRYPELDPFRTF